MSRKHFGVIFSIGVLFIASCVKKEEATVRLDPNPVETCYDGIQNNGEIDVDCGGNTGCSTCLGKMKAKLNGVSFVNDSGAASSVFGSVTNNNILFQGTSSSSNTSVSVIYTGTFAVGTYSCTGSVTKSTGSYNAQTGTITFTKFDTVNKIIDGTFSFTGINLAGGDSVVVSDGELITVPYQ